MVVEDTTKEGIMIVLGALILTRKRNWKITPEVQGKASYAIYATVNTTLVQQVKKTSKGVQDVDKSLEYQQHIDLQTEDPTRALSTKATPTEQAIGQDWLDIKY